MRNVSTQQKMGRVEKIENYELFFCQESGCKDVFEKKENYDAHLLEGNHTIIKLNGAMDNVRHSFISKMKGKAESHQVYSTEAQLTTISMDAACKQVPLMTLFCEPGWALPHRNTFRYSYKQKKFLYDQFEEGEKTGKKMSPEQVVLKMRKQFSTSE